MDTSPPANPGSTDSDDSGGAMAGVPSTVEEVLKMLDYTLEELNWGSRFKAHIIKRLLTPPTEWTPDEAVAAAEAEWDGATPAEHMNMFENDPEGAADESLSYWESDDG